MKKIILFVIVCLLSTTIYGDFSARLLQYLDNNGYILTSTILPAGIKVFHNNDEYIIFEWSGINIPKPTDQMLPTEEESRNIYQIIEQHRQDAKPVSLKMLENEYLQYCFDNSFTNKASIKDWRLLAASKTNQVEAFSMLMQAQDLIQNIQTSSGRTDAWSDIPELKHVIQ